MPSRGEQNAASAAGERDADSIIEAQLKDRAGNLESAAKADVPAYMGPIYPLAGEMIKDAVEALPQKSDAAIFLLDTGGGLIDVAERIARILRHHYGSTPSSEITESPCTRGSATLAIRNRPRLSVETIAVKNPKVDLSLVEEAREFIAERRANGRPRRGYNLASGHSRRFIGG